MKILHTSDWHLGKLLYGHSRYKEHELFLNWLVDLINKNKIDVLLVAGDIFDTTTPNNKVQGLYYNFLGKIAKSRCRHVVIIAGNHDSPSFLNAPQDLLKSLNVHVMGQMPDNIEDEVILLSNILGVPELIVCAVPYLRDKDLRTAESGENSMDKSEKLLDGLKKHYTAVADIARKIKKNNGNIPVIGMGHLYTAGGKIYKDDGVRELYMGTLAHVETSIFSDIFSYVALGHLHAPQKVSDNNTIRYSGSPLPIGFSEIGDKIVILVEIKGDDVNIKEVGVPVFQEIRKISGDKQVIKEQIRQLKQSNSNAWVEIDYTGEPDDEIQSYVNGLADGSDVLIFPIKMANRQNFAGVMAANVALEELNEYDVFEKCMSDAMIADESKEHLRALYKEIILALHEKDHNAGDSIEDT